VERRIVIVEDDPMTRGMLSDKLETEGFTVFSAASAPEGYDLCLQHDPDGVVLDIDLGFGPTGFDLADALRLEQPGLAILFLTSLPDARFAGRDANSLPKGVGYLRKEHLLQKGLLIQTLEKVLRGKAGITERDDQDPERPLGTLSASQVAVLRMVALGKSNQQIAEERGTSRRAVQLLVKRALGALGVDDDEGASRVVAARRYMIAAGIPLGER
jgi:DNA-binding NarL/FixJ family response regulator